MGQPEQAKEGFLSLPSTGYGKWSARLLLVSLALILLNNVVVMPVTERQADLAHAQPAFNLVVGLCVIATGISGIAAALIKRERSWVVVLAVLLLIVAGAFDVGPYVAK